ncbi:MAG: hypothetical protein AAF558_00025 [Verrucomicrobiota bacterium]
MKFTFNLNVSEIRSSEVGNVLFFVEKGRNVKSEGFVFSRDICSLAGGMGRSHATDAKEGIEKLNLGVTYDVYTAHVDYVLGATIGDANRRIGRLTVPKTGEAAYYILDAKDESGREKFVVDCLAPLAVLDEEFGKAVLSYSWSILNRYTQNLENDPGMNFGQTEEYVRSYLRTHKSLKLVAQTIGASNDYREQKKYVNRILEKTEAWRIENPNFKEEQSDYKRSKGCGCFSVLMLVVLIILCFVIIEHKDSLGNEQGADYQLPALVEWSSK